MWGILDSYLATCTHCGLCMEKHQLWRNKFLGVKRNLYFARTSPSQRHHRFKTPTNYKSFPMKREN